MTFLHSYYKAIYKKNHTCRKGTSLTTFMFMGEVWGDS